MRVQLAHDLADDTCALHIAAVGAQAHLVHLEPTAPAEIADSAEDASEDPEAAATVEATDENEEAAK
ncbi:hypothetical protein [Streptomyces shaanxiensis]